MHEMSLAQGVIDALEAQASRDAFSSVTRVVLEVGALSCVDAHALEFCFGAVSRDTIADGAALEIRTPPGRAHCFGCDQDVTVERRGDGCPSCGSHQLIVTGGEELKVKEMEVV